MTTITPEWVEKLKAVIGTAVSQYNYHRDSFRNDDVGPLSMATFEELVKSILQNIGISISDEDLNHCAEKVRDASLENIDNFVDTVSYIVESSDFDYWVKNLIVDQSTLEGFLKNALCNFDNISDWLSETIRVSCPDYDVPPFKKKLSDTKVLLAMIDYLVSEKAFHNYPVEIIEFLDEMIGAASQDLIVSKLALDSSCYGICIYLLQQSVEKITKSTYLLLNKNFDITKLKKVGHKPIGNVRKYVNETFSEYDFLRQWILVEVENSFIEWDGLDSLRDEKPTVVFLQLPIFDDELGLHFELLNRIYNFTSLLALTSRLEPHSNSTRYPKIGNDIGFSDYGPDNFFVVNHEEISLLLEDNIEWLGKFVRSCR